MAPRKVALLAAAVLLCTAVAAPIARAALVEATATDCAGFAAAQAALKQAYEAATSRAKVTLKLELACGGNFTCTSDAQLFNLNLTIVPNTKQPPIAIDINAGSSCSKDDSRPLIDVTALYPGSTVFMVREGSYPDTPLTFKISSVRAVGNQNRLVRVTGPGATNVKTILSVQDVTMTAIGIRFEGESFEMRGGGIRNATTQEGISASVFKYAKVERAVLANNSNAMEISVYAENAPILTPIKVILTRNTFVNNTGRPVDVTFTNGLGRNSATLSRNAFIANTAPKNQAMCISKGKNETRIPQISLTGTTGLDPIKPSGNASAPWPTDSRCTVALFTQA